jgi:guanylate kinase
VAGEKKGQLFIVSGPSGSGKTTVVDHLLKAVPDLSFSISCTTRAPRAGEQNGREYHFVSRDKFEEMMAADKFLEYASVFGDLYGTPRRNLEVATEEGKDLVLDIDVQGARQIKSRLPQAVAILLVPPSVEELEQRLRSRAQDDAETIRRRLNHARTEIEHYKSYDYLVVNHELEETCAEVVDIVAAERGSLDAKERAAGLRKDLNPERISAILETFGAQTR